MASVSRDERMRTCGEDGPWDFCRFEYSSEIRDRGRYMLKVVCCQMLDNSLEDARAFCTDSVLLCHIYGFETFKLCVRIIGTLLL